MLFIIHAAEAQFRRETESRTREHALLTSMRDRRAGETAFATANTADAPWLAQAAPAPIREAARAGRVTWARPIGVQDGTTVCATG
ncbi:MAG: hypothetical protein ACXWZG_04400 [Microbacterium sp.]